MGITPHRARSVSPSTKAVLIPSFIWCAQTEVATNGPRAREQLYALIRRERPDAWIGWSISCTTTLMHSEYDPADCLPYDDFRDSLLLSHWPDRPQRRYIDVLKPAVRERIARRMVEIVQGDRTFLALDNILGGNPEGITRDEWLEANFALVEAIYVAARPRGLPVVINVALRPEEGWERAARICDGLIFELPIHPNLRKDGAWIERELLAYRKVLDQGKLVGLIPLLDDKMSDAKRRYEAQLVAACAMLIREPGDALFVEPREYAGEFVPWIAWPQRLGAAQGKYQRDGTRFTRRFANGTLVVDTARPRVEIEP